MGSTSLGVQGFIAPRRLLSLEVFGEQLLDSWDLDPVYVVLSRAALSKQQLSAWLVAYWCFYDAGVASYLSEQERYWDALATAATNQAPTPMGTRWVRGAERRHFRGVAASHSVELLSKRYEHPADMVAACTGATCAEVLVRVRQHYLFGDWIGFKIADMLERLGLAAVSFIGADELIWKAPLHGAALAWAQAGRSDTAEPKRKLAWALQVLHKRFGERIAPPAGRRCCGIQEFETMLCKWASHHSGSYPIGKDTRELCHSLERWRGHSHAAELLSVQAAKL